MNSVNCKIEEAVRLSVESNKTFKQISSITGLSIYKIWIERKKRGLTGPYRQLKANEVKVLMSDMSITQIAAKLGMSNEQVSQYRYKQKKREERLRGVN